VGAKSSDKHPFSIVVNSSHHQAAEAAGDGLRVVARCPEDGVIEALEDSSDDHFVVAVQWHPERSVEDDESSRAIFRALVEAARARGGRMIGAARRS
jgi:putative glutamine amidotransferase